MFLSGYFPKKANIFKYSVINTHNLCEFWNKGEKIVYFTFALKVSIQNMKLYTVDICWF